ncbi:MAG TPA: hypothetical protein DCE44_12825 [Verrucomicrobiales bacterium]|nr:hypothetical protein [Verrucomicrobiales bacterium]
MECAVKRSATARAFSRPDGLSQKPTVESATRTVVVAEGTTRTFLSHRRGESTVLQRLTRVRNRRFLPSATTRFMVSIHVQILEVQTSPEPS